MTFQPTITNELTAELHSAQFGGEIIVVDKESQIECVCRDLAAQKIIGFDTETRPSFKAGVTNKVALLQLSTSERCYLIRLCRMKFHSALLKILSNPNIRKIGADVAGDIRSLHELRFFKERGFIDLQQIVPYWGIEEKSLRKMSAIVLGERVSKAQRLSNWAANVLTPQQQMYAATDAWVCIKIYEQLLATPPLQPLPSLEFTPPQPSAKAAKSKRVAAQAKQSRITIEVKPARDTAPKLSDKESREAAKPAKRYFKLRKKSNSTKHNSNKDE